MKKYFDFLMRVMLMLSVMLAVGCSEDDDEGNSNKNIPDPEGTIIVAVRSYDGSTWTHVRPQECDNEPIGISMHDNFFGYDRNRWAFATFGKVSGLGNINKIPTSGWTDQVAVIPGMGYVARYKYNGKTTYVRIYVIDYILSASSGGVIGANIKYQSPFEP